MKDNDSLKVKIPQLRLLLTANCIFNCQWCHSGGEGGAIVGYKKPEYELTHDEIKELISLFVKKGITHIKISGGEPLIRSDVVDIVKTLKSIQGVAYVEIVTRSPELKNTALLLCKAGIDSVTVSIDTLSEERFNKLTGYREESNVLKDIIMGIKLLRKENIPVKINFILQRDNKDEIMNLVNFAGDYGLTLKFIDFPSEMILKYIDKRTLPQETLEVAKRCDKFNIIASFTFITGFPNEIDSEIAKTETLIKEIRNRFPQHEIRIHIWAPFPGTSLYNEAIKNGFIPPTSLEKWSNYNYYEPQTPWLTQKSKDMVYQYTYQHNLRTRQ